MTLIASDIAIIVYSRGRQDCLTRLLDDLRSHYLPCLRGAALTGCVWVYAQNYSDAFLDGLRSRNAELIAANELVIVRSIVSHARIGDVAHAAIRAVHSRSDYKLAMLMDDDSVYSPDPVVDQNLQRAARGFITNAHQAYSIKLGDSSVLDFGAFVDLDGPIMPFKEKMLWVSRRVLDEVLDLPRFRELSLGEDAVISAVAWLSDPDACFAVQGMATFLHLGFESSDEFGHGSLPGGYAELMLSGTPPSEAVSGTKYDEALRWGVTPHHILPAVFVPEGHPHYEFNGICEQAVGEVRTRGRAPARLRPA